MVSFPGIGQQILNFIDGEWQASASGRWTDRYDPANLSALVARAPDSNREDAVRAITAAALAASAWRDWPAPKRGRFLFDWLGWIDSRREQLAELLTAEEGKTLVESRGEIGRARDILEYTAGMGRRLGGKVMPAEDQDVFCYTTGQPLGVVGLISPWNFPVAIPVWKLAPALVTGNTVVLKPSPLTPMTAAALVGGLEEVGVPRGVVNLVHGDTEPAVEIVHNARINGVSFTGSTKVGKTIARSAADRLLKVQLELGGKNPQIVLDDADLDLALDGVIAGAFGSTGQRCTATSRAIIADGIYEDFLNRIVERARAMKVGPGSVPGVEMGPLVDSRALARVKEYVEIGRSEGARVCSGGAPLDASAGLFFAPTVMEAR